MSVSMSKRTNHFKSSYQPEECLFLWLREWIISSLLSISKGLNHFKTSYRSKECLFLWVRDWIISSLHIDIKNVFIYE